MPYKNRYILKFKQQKLQVSIMVLEEGAGQFQLRYAFSTDKPTVCVKFSLGGESVFVVTDKIYQISLDDFQAR